MFLDGHASRTNVEWVPFCSKNKTEAFVNAANTSHVLQPYDQVINKRLQESMQFIRDEFWRQGYVDTAKVNFNLACAVHAWDTIHPNVVQKSFQVTGTYPFQPDFAKKFKSCKDSEQELHHSKPERLQHASMESRLPAVRLRQSDENVYQELLSITAANAGPSKKLQDI